MMSVRRNQLIGISFTSAAALMLEVMLTRIFSVTMWYHFAFLAISTALMGSAVAGVVIFFFPKLIQPDRAQRLIGILALALALLLPFTLILYLQIPFQAGLVRQSFPPQQVLWLALIYLDLMVPFFFSGAVLSMALATWPQQANRIYWADLSGAAAGCLLSIAVLDALGGAGAALAVSVLAACAGLAFLWERKRQRILALAATLALVFLTWGVAQQGWLTITSNKGGAPEPPRVYEHWNSQSRITVYETSYYPFFWSVDIRYWNKVVQEGRFLNHALLLIDAIAGTPIQEFRGLLHEVEFLRYDLTSFVYNLMEHPQTLVIGPGGGRDVLAALASGAPHVTAVEINLAIVAAMRGPFADFSGHLYERPDVTIVIDDARGYITRSPERYDVIQASLIDTWAAGASGAFALSENSLYTVEAFSTYYEHLTERGILTISRWYLTERPAETMRLVSTGMAGWALAGVADPRQHVAVVARPNPVGQSEGLATVLFKRTPFTPQEVTALKLKAEEFGFTVLYAPGIAPQEDVGRLIAADDHAAFIARYPLDISPATDDRPFFFNLVRFGDLFDPALRSGVYRTSIEAITILAIVLGLSATIGIMFVIFPLWLGTRRQRLPRPSIRLLAYFGLLGVAFMLIEIPAIQRLTVYLGRPVYALAIVLFSLLLFSGIGSLWSARWSVRDLRWQRRLFFLLTALAVLQAIGGEWIVQVTIGWPLPARLVITLMYLAPLGLLIGMPFPLGIRWAGTHRPGIVPWLWGINGVTSVLGSALSIALAIHLGFHVTSLIAALAYALAGFVLVWEIRQTLA